MKLKHVMYIHAFLGLVVGFVRMFYVLCNGWSVCVVGCCHWWADLTGLYRNQLVISVVYELMCSDWFKHKLSIHENNTVVSSSQCIKSDIDAMDTNCIDKHRVCFRAKTASSHLSDNSFFDVIVAVVADSAVSSMSPDFFPRRHFFRQHWTSQKHLHDTLGQRRVRSSFDWVRTPVSFRRQKVVALSSAVFR